MAARACHWSNLAACHINGHQPSTPGDPCGAVTGPWGLCASYHSTPCEPPQRHKAAWRPQATTGGAVGQHGFLRSSHGDLGVLGHSKGGWASSTPFPPSVPVPEHLRFETLILNERWPLWGPKRASPVPGALSVSTGSDALPLRTCRRLRECSGLRRRRIPRTFGHGSIVEDGSWVGVRKALCCGPSAVVRRGTDLHSAAGGVCLRRTRRSMSGDRSVALERRLLAPDPK